ncbi:hypothetical protein K1T71_011323 [Dendrolimus kikuchii]|uniref:Uncharacterized protein n=1 Tax=Dendrolimus kikuchii TaxID=765133 RepID=A0ACC1CNK1_9NEOP|nr:hypothetical protein K1T71_011323 [Dendrolimus kikuchii]
MDSISKDPILQFQPDAMEAIRKIYNLDGHERMTEAVNILDEWCKKQAHFKKKDFGKPHLEMTLLACKGSIEKAKKQIDRMCTLRTLLPHFFVDCNVKKDLKSITDIITAIVLPKLTKDYNRVYFIKVTDTELNAEKIMDIYRLNLIVCEYLKQHDYVNGFIVIYDFRNLNLMDVMRKINITEFQQVLVILIFLIAKIAGRLHVHTNIESLHDVVDRDILPIEYGGSEYSIQQLKDDWIDVLSSDEHVEHLKMINKASTDENYRQIDKFNDLHLGTPGTFRILNVD